MGNIKKLSKNHSKKKKKKKPFITLKLMMHSASQKFSIMSIENEIMQTLPILMILQRF